MYYIDCHDAPIEVHGLVDFKHSGSFFRVPDMKSPPHLLPLFQRPVGGRIRFRTNSATLLVRMELLTNEPDRSTPLTGSAGANIYLGAYGEKDYLGYVVPPSYQDKTAEQHVKLTPGWQDILIVLPRRELVKSIVIGVDDNAKLEAPTPYAVHKPVIFYGSSITEGGCASRSGNAYPQMLSRRLGFDYFNFGFSGNAKGEPDIADYIAARPMSAFVFDYDYNAPDAYHLQCTHQPFFEIVRKKHPAIPIILLSRPNFSYQKEESAVRREIIYQTYRAAIEKGDDHVFFINGESYFGTNDAEACTVDRVHPNDLGFLRMANTIFPVLKKALLTS